MRGALQGAYRAGLHRLAGGWAHGLGVILTMHHVRPDPGHAFAPSGILEITPEFLDALLAYLREENYDIIRMCEVGERLRRGRGGRRFAVLTFDDGYRDNAEYALPILRRHDAPCTVYVTRGFAEHTANMWWRDLEAIIRRESMVRCRVNGEAYELPTVTLVEKNRAYLTLYWNMRDLDNDVLRRTVDDLKATYPVDSASDVARMCMNWQELAEFAGDPLVSIGAHTLTHPKLAGCDVREARDEIFESRIVIHDRLGVEPVHFAYPFGDRTSAGPREFAMVREAGFSTGVTTRPGLLFAAHAEHMTALPRLSVNGYFQRIADMATLLSGLPLSMMRFGRQLDVA